MKVPLAGLVDISLEQSNYPPRKGMSEKLLPAQVIEVPGSSEAWYERGGQASLILKALEAKNLSAPS